MNYIKALGLMSGTSMDGLDCGLFDIILSQDYLLKWKCITFRTIGYSKSTRHLIRSALSGDEASILDAHNHLGKTFASHVKEFLKDRKVAIIASHGQTISHIDGISTCQIGNPKDMNHAFHVPVVYNVRQADIDVGGNGAPLMPFLDWLIFKESRKNTITLNLGGVANISYIPVSGIRDEVIGFDTGPGMAMMDEISREIWGLDMDQDGLKTANGKINSPLLNKLMKIKYITKPPPKSTSRDEFGLNIVKQIIQENPHLIAEDLLRTFCAFTAKSISINIKSILNFNKLNAQLIISGGGINHSVLMDDIFKFLKISSIKISDEYGIDAKMKESLLMAVLAVARMKNITANMPSVSGASMKIILGDIFNSDSL